MAELLTFKVLYVNYFYFVLVQFTTDELPVYYNYVFPKNVKSACKSCSNLITPKDIVCIKLYRTNSSSSKRKFHRLFNFI